MDIKKIYMVKSSRCCQEDKMVILQNVHMLMLVHMQSFQTAAHQKQIS